MDKYRVEVEYDGCLTGQVLFGGTRANCIQGLRLVWGRYAKGKQSLALINETTGRCESFGL